SDFVGCVLSGARTRSLAETMVVFRPPGLEVRPDLGGVRFLESNDSPCRQSTEILTTHSLRSHAMILDQLGRAGAPTIAIIMLLCTGCDDGKPAVDTSKREATVSGTVKVKGKLADGGFVLFNASNSERIVPHKKAEISKDGTYTV